MLYRSLSIVLFWFLFNFSFLSLFYLSHIFDVISLLALNAIFLLCFAVDFFFQF